MLSILTSLGPSDEALEATTRGVEDVLELRSQRGLLETVVLGKGFVGRAISADATGYRLAGGL